MVGETPLPELLPIFDRQRGLTRAGPLDVRNAGSLFRGIVGACCQGFCSQPREGVLYIRASLLMGSTLYVVTL